MSLRSGSPNVLNVHKIRMVKYPPPHFKYIQINSQNHNLIDEIKIWIEYNCNNRYYIGKDLIIDKTNSFVNCYKLGFEDPKEATFFKLACPFYS